jgi:hypothetical protein
MYKYIIYSKLECAKLTHSYETGLMVKKTLFGVARQLYFLGGGQTMSRRRGVTMVLFLRQLGVHIST